MDAKRRIKSLRDSFRFAFAGFLTCINSERNMRIHLSAFLLLSVFSYYYGLDRFEFMIFTLVCGLVMFAEMVNTAVEALVDLASPAYHRLAKAAKDVAAGAVLLCAAVAVIVGLCLFSDLTRLTNAFWLIWLRPYRILLFALLAVLLTLFVFCGGGIISKRKNK